MIEITVSRQQFLKFGFIGVGSVFGLTACGNALKNTIETSTPQYTNPNEVYFKYYVDQNLPLREHSFVYADRNVTVVNMTDMVFDANNFEYLNKYFERYNDASFSYALNSESGSTLVTPTVADWQKKGKILVVPRRAGIPNEVARFFYNDQTALTVYFPVTKEYTTFIRVPDQNEMPELAPKVDVNREQYVQLATITEACQTNLYVQLANPYPNTLALPSIDDQRTLTQEGVCNTFYDAAKYLLQHVDYSPEIFGLVRKFPASDGKDYEVWDKILTPEEYYFLPTAPYLKTP